MPENPYRYKVDLRTVCPALKALSQYYRFKNEDYVHIYLGWLDSNSGGRLVCWAGGGRFVEASPFCGHEFKEGEKIRISCFGRCDRSVDGFKDQEAVVTGSLPSESL